MYSVSGDLLFLVSLPVELEESKEVHGLGQVQRAFASEEIISSGLSCFNCYRCLFPQQLQTNVVLAKWI